jgi:F-type H+-transporting ATPase subunit delta
MAELITLARPYARAAFEFASASDTVDEWSQTLEMLRMIATDETMMSVINNPSLTSGQKTEVIFDVCGEKLSDSAKNFVSLISENNRLPLVCSISDLFEQFKRLRNKSVDVEITSAFELDDTQQQALAEALTRKLERKVNITSNTDASILGGVIVHAEDQVIDASIRGRLMKLAEAINS